MLILTEPTELRSMNNQKWFADGIFFQIPAQTIVLKLTSSRKRKKSLVCFQIALIKTDKNYTQRHINRI